MTRQELTDFIFDEYSVEPDYPFPMDDVTCVFRHIDNRKWFGITMAVPYRTIGINRDGSVDILNIKCDPIMMGSFCGRLGFCPAYHSFRAFRSMGLTARISNPAKETTGRMHHELQTAWKDQSEGQRDRLWRRMAGTA